MHEMPKALQEALEEMLSGKQAQTLARDARAISEAYRNRTGEGRRLLTKEDEAAAYAAARMPATYAAAHMALGEALLSTGLEPRTLLDCGAGTGAATFAAHDLLACKEITCLERERAMRTVGSALMQRCGGTLAEAKWADWDLTENSLLPRADLVIEGYMLGELKEEARVAAARRLYEAAEQMLVLIEPGTPQGFANLKAIRQALTKDGAHVAAPCPNGAAECPMSGADWCHFTVRLQRSKLQKTLKGGEAPYEDEKFAYLVLTRGAAENACDARVVRHPTIAPGRITLSLCGAEGQKMRVVTKKDPLWKRARKIETGDRV